VPTHGRLRRVRGPTASDGLGAGAPRVPLPRGAFASQVAIQARSAQPPGASGWRERCGPPSRPSGPGPIPRPGHPARPTFQAGAKLSGVANRHGTELQPI